MYGVLFIELEYGQLPERKDQLVTRRKRFLFDNLNHLSKFNHESYHHVSW